MSFNYDTDLFDEVTIRRMAGHFQRLLEGIVADPGQPIIELPLLTEDERQQLLVQWNDTARSFPADRCIHQLFEEQAARMPESVAVTCGNEQLTYRELNVRANRLAHYLSSLGVAPEHRVILLLDRSVEFIVGVLAILKTGASYVPLDTSEPPARLRFLVDDTGASVLICCARLEPDLHLSGVQYVPMDDVALHLERQPDANLSRRNTVDDLACVMYTSGSTGRPKGVMVKHRGIVRLVCGANYVAFGEAQRFLLLASPAFDASTFELWGALLHGSTCVVYPGRVPDLDDLERLLREQQITCMWLTSSLFNAVVDHRPEALAGLSQLIIGGEALSIEHVRRFRDRVPAVALVNGYGPTEGTTFTCTYPIPRELPAQRAAIPIGRPIANTEVYVLDRVRQPVPIGVPGELYIGGDGLARGYLNLPELTEEKFVADPFGRRAGARLYRSGDRVRWRDDGNLEFLGRLDHQVKVRGYRIELGEIETVLGQHPEVRDQAVVARQNGSGENNLVAYVVPRGDVALTYGQLRAYLESKLPAYMIPSGLVVLDALPLSANGKLDRRALPDPGVAGSAGSGGYAAPRSEVEERLALMWAEALGLERVGVHDNFFELGGHSLMAIGLFARIEAAFRTTISLAMLFRAQTVAALADVLTHAPTFDSYILLSVMHPANGKGPMPREASVAPLPLSFEQQSLWFIDRLSPGLAAYHIPLAVRITGSLDVSALRWALDALVIRHESLRTNFDLADGMPIQVVGSPRPVPLRETDLTNCPDDQRESELRLILDDEVRRPFDLTHDILLRGVNVRMGAQEHVLRLVIHHIVADGWSIGILLRELAELYRAASADEAPSLATLPIQFADFALWQRQQLQGEALETQIAFWRRYLEGAPDSLALPTDRTRPPLPSFRGAMHTIFLPESLSAELKALGRRENVTLFMTLLAAFEVLIARYSGQDDIVVGSPITGRNRVDLERLIGFFVNTLALRTDLTGNPTFRELLGRIRESTLDAFAHKDLPFARLVEELKPGRSSNQTPLFQVLFALEYLETTSLQVAGLAFEPLEFDFNWAKFDLSLTISERSGGLRVSLNYDTDLFDEVTIRRMAGHFQRLLEGIVADPGQPIIELPLLTEDERQQMLVQWNDTARGIPADRCIHQLFEEQAARTPESVAVVFQDQRLTYAELNARSDQLAQYLRDLGVGPEMLVAICLERSVEMVVGLLGILKAGGAYLPLDPSYPAARLGFMIDDARPRVVLTQRRLVDALPPHTATVVCLDEPLPPTAVAPAASRIGPDDRREVVSKTSPGDLAYVLYTSGSTGGPKGVQIPQSAVVNLLTSMRREPGLVAADTLLAVTTLAFDIAALELFLPLTTGARVVIATREVAADGRRLAQLLEDSRATVMQATPATWRMLLQAGWEGSPRLKILCGGEALARDLAERLLARCAALWNLYGPTETTIWSAAWRVLPGEPITIGRPIANTQFYILDRLLRPAPVGVSGELFIGGEGLARGYLNQPELTAERFIEDPFRPESGGRLYRTGDCVRYRPDGCLEYLGRLDHQVKVRGHRIELGEIEAVLSQHPQVRDRAVVARQDVSGENSLVAYVVPRGDVVLTYGQLRAFLQPKLPAYMIPSALVVLDALPLTANGKLDRRALPDPAVVGAVASGGYAEPRTEVETRLASLWAEALGRERVGIHDNFFELGGHSLMATGLFSRMESEFGRTIPLATLFRAQTVAEMAGILIETSNLDPRPRTVTFQTGDSRHPPLFLVHALSGVYLFWRPLINHLGNDRPIYGLTLPEKDGIPQPFSDFKALAAYHVENMCAVQPEGPFNLAGYCFGATLAFEIAQQLVARGREVAFLGSIDWGPSPTYRNGESSPSRLLSFTRNLYYWLIDDFFVTPPRELLWRARRRLKIIAEHVGIIAAPTLASPTLPGIELLEIENLPDEIRRMIETNFLARMTYEPRPYPGRVTLLRARYGALFRPLKHDLGWDGFALGGLEIYTPRGNHWNIIAEPQAQDLAYHLRKCLEEADRSSLARRRSPSFVAIAAEMTVTSGSSSRWKSSVTSPAPEPGAAGSGRAIVASRGDRRISEA